MEWSEALSQFNYCFVNFDGFESENIQIGDKKSLEMGLNTEFILTKEEKLKLKAEIWRSSCLYSGVWTSERQRELIPSKRPE